ncbi:molybdopterin-guanine dinucleotide biosynthesis protein MobA [Hymenobacter setariae]|uniref:Molybdopterin-guanine dinucleotide biosynthesis protein MobA n=1 Tax=Hymenobacter setariae TaxID=2594794 RepID=A0A558BL58_9BACT|nr:NTP transferase domain-containing protein [Hymenobacter setariae]TVT37236.1 molybdopterin-guanine dinucleotide biosynthesis protein MobA [Hymenobacter setariae]
MNPTTPPRTKHADLTRPDLGEFARHELAFLGAPCGDIQKLAARLTATLAPAGHRVGYVDADHASGDADETATLSPLLQAGAAVEVTDKIHFRRRDERRALDRFSQPDLLSGTDLVLVNGNHFRARHQVVMIDPRKTLAHKLDKLTDVVAFVLADGVTELPEYLQAHLPHHAQLPQFAAADAAGLATWVQQWLGTRQAPLRGLVLAGGLSQRMQTDKGRLSYGPDGREQREVAAALLAEVCQDVFVSCRAEQAAEMPAGLEPLPDTFLGLGPLGGILSAFRKDPNAAWLVLACDLPFMTADALRQLVAGRQSSRLATAFRSPSNDFPEPLITIFEPRAYPELLRFLGLGYSCPRKMLINSDVEVLPTPASDVLRNVNTPAERDTAQQELSGKL